MKQQKTTVLIALLTVVAYTLGHASVTVKDGWEEPIVVWLAVILKTGTHIYVLFLWQSLKYSIFQYPGCSNFKYARLLKQYCTFSNIFTSVESVSKLTVKSVVYS